MTPEQPTGINPDLIAKYLAAGDLPNLIAIFNFQRRQMTRAEDLSRAYLAQMIQMKKQMDEQVGQPKGDHPREREIRVSHSEPPRVRVRPSQSTTALDDL